MKTKISVLSITFILICMAGFSQQTQHKETKKQGTLENPIEIQKAKHHVYVELEKTIDENGKETTIVKNRREIIIPNSFPKFIDTGNPKQDEVKYHEDKQKWIRENPIEYEKIKHLNL